MGPASPHHIGRRLSASEVSSSLPSRPPPCLRLPTPTGDPPPRSPLSKKSSPPTGYSFPTLCSNLAAAPSECSKLAQQLCTSSSSRYELAAIAILSSVSASPKASSSSQIQLPTKLTQAAYRPSSPLPLKSAATVPDFAAFPAKSAPRKSLDSASPATEILCNRRNSIFSAAPPTVPRWGPQAASPVPRKSGSSLPPPPPPLSPVTLRFSSGRQANLFHSRLHNGLSRPSRFSQEELAATTLFVPHLPFLTTHEVPLEGGNCVHNAYVNSPEQGLLTRAQLNSSAPAEYNRDHGQSTAPRVQACAASLLGETRPDTLQRKSTVFVQKASPAELATGNEVFHMGEGPFLSQLTFQCSPPVRREGNGGDMLLVRKAQEKAQPAASPHLPSHALSLSPFHPQDSPAQRCDGHRGYCTLNRRYAAGMECRLTQEAGRNLSPPVSFKPEKNFLHQAEHPTVVDMWNGPRQYTEKEQGANKRGRKSVPSVSSSYPVNATPVCCTRPTGQAPYSPRAPPFRAGRSSSLRPAEINRHEKNAAGCCHRGSGQAPRAGRLSVFPSHLTNAIDVTGKPFSRLHAATSSPQRDTTNHFSTNSIDWHFSRATADNVTSASLADSACLNGDVHQDTYRTSCSMPSLTPLAAADVVAEEKVSFRGDCSARISNILAEERDVADTVETSVSSSHLIRQEPTRTSTTLSTGSARLPHAQRDRCYQSCNAANDGVKCCPDTQEDALLRDPLSSPLSQDCLTSKDFADEKTAAEVVIASDSEAASVFLSLQRSLKEMLRHRTALRPSEVIFQTTLGHGCFLSGAGADQPAVDSSRHRKKKDKINTLDGPETGQVLHYCVLEEGSFGKIFMGRFLGRLPTDGRRRWWRMLPLGSRFAKTIFPTLPCPRSAFLSPHAQEALEVNAKVAIKVPVETMVARDPLGILARTLNEWNILALVHEKRNMLFSHGYGKYAAIKAFDGRVENRGTFASDGENSLEEFSNFRHYREAFPSTSSVVESWHPMHPQAEPPGVVELVGGVVHGPLDVWLVTRLAPGKDLHTRKYSRTLANGGFIPPAAGLAMCRQLAAIVDFLHAKVPHTSRPWCGHRQEQVGRASQEVSKGRMYQDHTYTHGFLGGNTSVCSRFRGPQVDVQPGAHFCSSVEETPVIVHRDIKPENIIVDDDWRIQLCDFGDAEASAEGLVSRVSGATWLYAPVELLCAASFGERSSDRNCKCKIFSLQEAKNDLATCLSGTQTDGDCRVYSCPAIAKAVQPRVYGDAGCVGECLVSTGNNSGTLFTEKWDIWSMGCVFQEMFGLPNPMSPYVAPSDPPQVIYEKLRRRAHGGQLLPIIAPEIQGIARQIIFACLKSDPHTRPTATAVVRMWSAPEEEILKDIHIRPSNSAPAYDLLIAEGVNITKNDKKTRPETFSPPASARAERRREFTPDREQEERTDDKWPGRFPSFPAAYAPNSKFERFAEVKMGTAACSNGYRGHGDVYIVPNLALVTGQCDSSSAYTSSAS